VPIQPDVTVLLVEDEASVRQFVRRTLEQAGYTVLEATNPHEALNVLELRAGIVDLVLTDIMMPGMSGRLMAERLNNRYPALRMLFMSGNDEIVQLVNAREGSAAILSKPFTPSALLERITYVLDARAA
jgi:CheY-like chemotaxis protein